MKKLTSTLFIVGALLATVLSTYAVPIGSSNEAFDYAVRGRDLSRLSMGLYSTETEREIRWKGTGAVETLKSQKVQGYFGVDIVRWLTLYAVGGQSDVKFGNNPSSDGESEFGFGFRANLLNHFIREPAPMEDTLRLNLGGQFTRNKADNGAGEMEWDEMSVALTMALVNHTTSYKLFAPESIALYFGPLFSQYVSDDFEAEDDMGAVIGMEIFFMDTIVLDLEVQHFEETSAGVGINFHF